ncbi:ATP-binding protein [Microbacterium sp. lyk4-40-TSB-66]|uniref:ATP-binding protein n=1 Tax=Microbacterium sp. lyk4-40-TSB-66 TaxID=3040294 RepID=UPI00254BF881|nr:ATP-binding protein [Microbacterium sp. lyk4-40-TSB-66]
MSVIPGGEPPAGPDDRGPHTLTSIRRSIPRDWDEQVDLFAIVKLDSGGFVRGWNLGAERIKGYTEEQIIGCHFSQFYREDARRRGIPDQLLAAAQRDGHVEDTGWRVRNDGSEFWARVTISAIRNDQGQVLGFVKIVRDLTSEKRASDDRAAARRSLAGDLLSPATELREHLAQLAEELGPDHRILRLAAEAGDRILTVAETIGGVADTRARQGRRSETFAVVVRDAVSVVLPGDTHGRVVFGRMDAVPVCADVRGLRNAVAHVLENAAKYSDDVIDVDAYETDEGAAVRVHDRGRGIPSDDLAAILLDGRRGRSGAEEDGGRGSGLATAQRTVGEHGGILRITSVPGEGTTVTITIPRSDDTLSC